ncbi:MAG: ATP-binding protein [Candidatus Micrarchaeota archaeon]
MVGFSFGMPVSRENFFDREAELARLLARTGRISDGARNDIAVIGSRRVGKSSLTNKLAEELEARGICCIQIDCEGLPLPVFLREYSTAVIGAQVQDEGVSRQFRESVKQGLSATLAALSEVLGRVRAVEVDSVLADFLRLRIEVEKLPESELKGERLYGFFSQTIALPETLGKKCVVIFDEFQETASYGIFGENDFHALFRRAVQAHKNVCYVYTGSATGMMEDIFAKPENPLAGNADILRVGPFDEENSGEFVKAGLVSGGKKIDEAVLAKLFEETGGFPAYLNWLGLRFLENPASVITEKEYGGLFDEMLSPASAVHQGISKQLVKLGSKTRKILSVIALGNSAPPKIELESGAKNVYVYLARLQNYGLVKKEAGKFSLVDPVIAEGLRRGVF